MKISRTFALFISGALGACIGESAEDDRVEEAEQAVLAGSWNSPACTLRSDDPPGFEMESANFCAGPWEYRQALPVNVADSHCPQRWSQCRAWTHGYEFAERPTTNPLDQHIRSCRKECDPGSSTSCTPTRCTLSSPTPQSFCNQQATNRKAQLISPTDPEGVPPSTPGYNFQELSSQTTVNGTPNTEISNYFIDWADERQDVDIHSWTETTRCTLNVPRGPRPRLGRTSVCPQDGWETCSHNHDGGTVRTAPEMAKPTDVFGSTAPLCTTCDDERLGTIARNKYQCLDRRFMSFFTDTAIRGAVTARMKLLLPLAADRLTESEREGILEAYEPGYGEFPYDGEPSCEAEPLAVSEACADEATAIEGKLRLCRTLGTSLATPAAAGVMFSYCTSLADEVVAIPPGSGGVCHDEYVELFADILETIAGRIFSGISTANYEESLAQGLRTADSLFHALEALSEGDVAWLRGRTSPLLKQFFEKAYEARFDYPRTPFGPDQEEAVRLFIALASTEGRATDVDIMRAAFTATPPPTSSALLLAVLSDGLRTTAEHAYFLSELHDVACRYRGCAPDEGSPLLDFWRIVAALPDAVQLGQALALANDLQADSPGLIQAFQAVRANHARLAAVLPFPDERGEVPPEELPAGGEELLELIAKARRYIASYAETGILIGGGEHSVLNSLPHRESTARELLNERVGTLRFELDSLGSSRVTLVNALLQQIQNGGEIGNLGSRLEIVNQRLRDAGARYDGLSARQREQRESYAGVLAGFEAMVAAGTVAPGEAVNVQPITTPPLTAGDAEFDGVHDGDNVAVFAAPQGGANWVARLSPGEQLRFSVNGEWSPVCALNDLNFQFPDSTDRWAVVNLTTAKTGPEGFQVQFGTQGLEAWSTRNSLGSTVEGCLTFDPAPGLPPPVDGSGRTGECIDYARQHGYDTSQGLSVTARFDAGIRIPSTPFPEAPAGSLLAVLTRASSQTIVDVQVVHRQSSITAPRPPAGPGGTPLFNDYDVYLVVNDRTGCGTPSSAALGVTVTKVVPFENAAIAVSQGMATVLRDTEAQAAGVIRQGAFPSSEQLAMKSLAWSQLQTAVGMDLNLIPALRDLFNAWLDMQVASIDRRVQIADVARTLAEMKLEVQALEQDLRWAGHRARLLTLVPRWMLRNINQEAMRADLRGLFSSLDADMPPLFTLRHPSSLATFRGTSEYADEMDALMQTGFADSTEAAAEQLADFGEHVSQALLSAENSNPVGTKTIVLAFPTPEQCAANCTLSPLGRTEFEEFRVPSREAIMTVWQSLRANRTAMLSLTPADLYEAIGEASRLSCDDHAPVIRRMALAGDLSGTSNPGWHTRGFSSRGRGMIENHYPTGQGALVYRRPPLSDAVNLPLASVLLADDLAQLAYPRLAEVGAGMSPVNEFAIELTAIAAGQFNRIDALYLIIEVETQTTAADVAIPGVCEA